jgi:2-dehydro-3-deoxygluconokinase
VDAEHRIEVLLVAEDHVDIGHELLGGGDSFASGLIWSKLTGRDDQASVDFAVAFSALCHTIRNDWDLCTREEAEALAAGGSARVKR